MLNLALLAMALGGASASSCSYISGNYYCDQTELVQYENVGFSSSYDRVTSFNSDGTCSNTPQSFSGSLAPFNEELSVHFRGPIQLENFKVFTKGSNSGAYNQKRDLHELHHRHAEPEPVIVTATNYYTAYVTEGADQATETSTTVAAAAPAVSTSSVAAAPVVHSSSSQYNAAPVVSTRTTSPEQPTTSSTPYNNWKTTSSSSSVYVAPTTHSSSSSAPSATSSGSWALSADYNAGAGSADGLVFLNNLGGSGSGVFDYTFGNSLSYCASDGTNAASSPQVLSQTTVGSDHEFIIFSDTECSNDDCGYTRPGTVAYHGFGGANKVFVFEFGMPTNDTGGYNSDMPAVWLLNAQIPRTLQYGASSCSCWSSGCGELDLWEILNSGNDRLVSTLHDNQNGGGGSSNYFSRPTQGTFKGAAVFTDTTISVVQISEIPSSIDDSLIQSWIDQAGTASTVNL